MLKLNVKVLLNKIGLIAHSTYDHREIKDCIEINFFKRPHELCAVRDRMREYVCYICYFNVVLEQHSCNLLEH